MEKSRTPVIILAIVAILLGGTLIVMIMQYNKMKQENIVAVEAIEEQKGMLTNELQDLNAEYEDLKTENDSMNTKIEAQQSKIKELLTLNASNVEKIRLYKKELGTLRDIMKSYVVQIDSLNRRNQMLVAENQEVRGKLDEARVQNENLTQEKDNLSTKVSTASALSAKNIVITPLTKRSNDTEKASRAAKLKTCFTVRENAIAPAGTKTVYIRISRPDNMLLAVSEDYKFNFEGQDIAYTEKRDIEYDNRDVDLCIFWDNSANNLITGNYSVDIFCDGKLIGSTTFALK